MESIKPVFIIGTEQSGTTILEKMLAMHPDFAWFSQYSCRGGEVPGRSHLPLYGYFNRILRLLFTHDWRKEEGRIKIIPRPGEAHQIWDYIIPKEKNIPQEELVARVRKTLRAECRAWRKDSILSKAIRLHNYIPTLKEAFPESKFIHIIRDGRALTLRRKYKSDERMEKDEFIQKAERWVKNMNTINQQKTKADFFELRYEDFCIDVHGYLRKILNYLNLEAKKFPFSKCPKTLTPTNPRWFNMATQEDLNILNDIQKETLKKHGYLSK